MIIIQYNLLENLILLQIQMFCIYDFEELSKHGKGNLVLLQYSLNMQVVEYSDMLSNQQSSSGAFKITKLLLKAKI